MSVPAPSTRRFPWPVYIVLFALIVLIAFLPLFSFASSFFLIDLWHCTVNEASSYCEQGGADAGYWVQFLSFSFLYVFVTWPLAFVLALVWLIVMLIHRANFRRHNPA